MTYNVIYPIGSNFPVLFTLIWEIEIQYTSFFISNTFKQRQAEIGKKSSKC